MQLGEKIIIINDPSYSIYHKHLKYGEIGEIVYLWKIDDGFDVKFESGAEVGFHCDNNLNSEVLYEFLRDYNLKILLNLCV